MTGGWCKWHCFTHIVFQLLSCELPQVVKWETRAGSQHYGCGGTAPYETCEMTHVEISDGNNGRRMTVNHCKPW